MEQKKFVFGSFPWINPICTNRIFYFSAFQYSAALYPLKKTENVRFLSVF